VVVGAVQKQHVVSCVVSCAVSGIGARERADTATTSRTMRAQGEYCQGLP
jgi:hypothetical protein